MFRFLGRAASIWWVYIGIALVSFLLVTGQFWMLLWTLVQTIAIFVFFGVALWLMLGGGRKKKTKRIRRNG